MPEGQTKRSYRQEDWEARLRPIPRPEQVLALLASHGAAACIERWGTYPSHLIRRAKRPRRGTGSAQK